MLDDPQRRNYSPHTVRSYMHAVESFASYFHRSPDQLGPDHIREYQVHLFRDCKLSPRTIEGQTAALRFLFLKTLGRTYTAEQVPFPKCHKRLPSVLSQQEVARLIGCCGSLMQRAMVMTLYATGLRRAELCRLKVADIDSERMVLHVQRGKGGRDRDVPLSPKLLGVLREYWRWMKPKTYLFPGMENNWRADVPITEKVVWIAVTNAAKAAHGGKQKVMTVSSDEFLRRFLLHVLRIRHFGLFANRRRATSLACCRALLSPARPPELPPQSSPLRCPFCSGPMLVTERITGSQLLPCNRVEPATATSHFDSS